MTADSTSTRPLYLYLCLGLVTVLSFFTYVQNYSNPPAFFWDENYHVASAQKYLNGVFFMEQHPPLGKLLIAAGEGLLNRNQYDNQFIGTDYAQTPPPGFSFAGYRLFPVLLSWLGAPLFFLCLWLLSKDLLTSTIFSFLYVFDNAFIVHMRGAMLEGPLMFFCLATILAFLLHLHWKDHPQRYLSTALWMGVALACAIATKVVGLILLLLLPSLFLLLPQHRAQVWKGLLFTIGTACIVYMAVWQIHFTLGSRIVPTNNDGGYYQASQTYRQALDTGTTGSLAYFPIMLRDSLMYVSHYNSGVPELDLCKADENGSPFFFWPVGARSINYRWETADGTSYSYLYLQSNPVTWGIGLVALLVTLSLLVSSVINPTGQRIANAPLMLVFLAMYFGYMGAMSQISRVMYLYHYFLPLLLTFFLAALLFLEIKKLGSWALTPERRSVILVVLGGLIFCGWQFYHPLTYYEPMNDQQFARRNIFPLWDLKCVHCSSDSLLLNPNKR